VQDVEVEGARPPLHDIHAEGRIAPVHHRAFAQHLVSLRVHVSLPSSQHGLNRSVDEAPSPEAPALQPALQIL
jgi:hypothetical protein